MSRRNKFNFIWVILAIGLALPANSVMACAACFGKSDSPLAQGMNWGIFSLLAMVVCVLSGIASFFIYLARKSATVAAAAAQDELLSTTQKV